MSSDINFVYKTLDQNLEDLHLLFFHDKINIDKQCFDDFVKILEQAQQDINKSYVAYRKRCNLPLRE